MLRSLLGVALVLALVGCGGGSSLVPLAPPAPKVERRPLKPGSDVFWSSGHWAWKEDPGIYYWVPGTWTELRRKRIWIPGYWEAVQTEQGQKWRWVPDHWEDTE